MTIKRKAKPKKKVTLYKGKTLPRGKLEKLRERKGSSSAGRYKRIAKKDFAGPSGGAAPGTFPIHDLAHARNALARAHFAPNPAGIRRAVYRKYPRLRKRKLAREGIRR